MSPRAKDDFAPRRPAWFWWGLANLLALCFAVTSWTLTMEIFGRPDVPRNYEILRKLGREPDFKSYTPQGAPEGRVFDPPALYAWYFNMGEDNHDKLNSLYRRNFMRNFDDSRAVTYVEGSFEVLATRRFGKEDFLPEGLAVRAQALVRPDAFSNPAPYPVILELMLPTSGLESVEKVFKPGVRFNLAKAPQLPVVMHVGRHMEQDEPVVQLTVLPIGYGQMSTAQDGAIVLWTPEWVRPEGRFPLFEPETGREESP